MQTPKGTRSCDLRGAENRGRSTCYASYVDEPLAFIVGVGGAANTKYVHSNHLYSAAALTDNTGAVVERFRYDAYGRRTVTDAAGVSRQASSYGFQTGFTGRYKDIETGLSHFRCRYFSDSLARFISRDPWSEFSQRKAYFAGLGNPGMAKYRLARPAAGDGYKDGMSLYGAFFVPNRTDPMGELSRTIEFHCASIHVDINPQAGQAIVTITATLKEGCCCEAVVPKQWWDQGTGMKDDNGESKLPFYNYDPATGQFLSPETGLGGDGKILDKPGVMSKYKRTWNSCFYCKRSGEYILLGCVGWGFDYSHEKGDQWDIEDKPPMPPGLPLPPGQYDWMNELPAWYWYL